MLLLRCVVMLASGSLNVCHQAMFLRLLCSQMAYSQGKSELYCREGVQAARQAVMYSM